jgi:diguanylate cyclase (GGDEF)-like protein
MCDDSQESMLVKCSVGLNAELFYNGVTSPGASISMATLKSGETFNGPFCRDDININAKPGFQWFDIKSAVIVPIIHQDKSIGTLNLYHREENAFSEFDEHLLEQIASRSALAIYNGLLFERTQNHANTDGLTNLFNLRYISEFVENKYINNEEKEKFVLMCLDLDLFKPINDVFGHQEGDRVLRDLSKILRSVVRGSDVVARYGGDEFLIVLDHCSLEGAQKLSRQISESVHDYDTNLIHPSLGRLHLGVSIGLARFPEDGADWPSLLSVADKAMFSQKAERKLGRLVESPGEAERPRLAA